MRAKAFYSRSVLVCAAMLLGPLAQSSAIAGERAGDDHHARPTVRRGTAAAPIGGSAVIADFDADGAPDVAIADRTIPRGAGYQIEIQLGGGPTQRVSFVSLAGALNITALDVDNDRDADLVVMPVLSRQIVGVWLNDGTGHFARETGRPRGPVPALGTAGRFGALPPSFIALTSQRPAPPGAPVAGFVFRRDSRAGPFRLLPSLINGAAASIPSPRAPPSFR